MGKLIWHDLARHVSLTASFCTPFFCLVAAAALTVSSDAVWASFWGFFFRKFFWDFVGGILRAPGGLQPSPKFAIFITIIVKFPIVQMVTMALGFFMIALEYPLSFLRGTALHRSMPLKVVLLTIQASLAVLFYQGTNAALWSLIAAVFYTRALTLGESMQESKRTAGRAGEA